MYLHNIGKIKVTQRNYAGVGVIPEQDLSPEDQFQGAINKKNQAIVNYQDNLRKTP